MQRSIRLVQQKAHALPVHATPVAIEVDCIDAAIAQIRRLDAQPRRLGDLMVGQLTFHAGMHAQQLQELLDA